MARAEWSPRVRRVNESERDRLLYVGSLMREKRLDEARAELEGILKQNGKSFAANLTLGMVCQNQRNPKEAARYFKNAIAIDPLRAQGHVLSGYCALQLDDADGAAAAFKTAIDIDQKLVGAHIGLARALEGKGDVDGAFDQVSEAVKLDPQSVQARVLLAQTLNRAGRKKEAIKELENFLKIRPGNLTATVLLSMLYSQENKDEKAAQLLESAVVAQPERANLWSLLGRVKQRMEDYVGAEKAFREAMNLRPRSAWGPLRVVGALLPQGKYDDALEMLGRVSRRGRTAVLAHKYYGDVFAAQGNVEEAVRSYRAAIINSKDGEERIAEVDKALGGETDPAKQLKRYSAEIAVMDEALRKGLAGLDWQAVLRRIRPQPTEGAELRAAPEG